MITFINNLFNPVLQLLNDVLHFLSHMANVTGAGINISDYISWIGVLDPAWQGDIDALLSGLSFIVILFLARSIYRFYLSLKNGIEWW
ncbi:hypothetical protein SAMN04489725_11615 [Alicyclobacillus hesperidum]|uniref:Uncharacterized protein n=1 Tax=Alicyclobacillus hesperidum TaxID=89784 RepID=A0A1H2WNQ4_9BACL|nr:hypothetical protein [Alicyclobacillus hesperidum]SDW82221.1 hypothetical protein SAMN04489725_11615 [Alicyclobacillus hesperidum]